LIDEKVLEEALASGKIKGAALDVFENEPPTENPLLNHRNLIVTPHLGASTLEAQENVATAVAEQIVDYLIAGTVRNAVNVPSVPADQLPSLSPYINLAERMGLFTGQVVEGGITQVTVEYSGDVSNLKLEPVTLAALKGLLTPIIQENVNYVNAPLIAKDRGIEVKVSKSADTTEYTSLITLKVKAGGKDASVAGTLNSKKEPRIIQVDDFPMETVPEGDMLVLMNNDKPGVIGGIGTLMGQNGINIARMQFGREKQGGRAMSVVSVDSVIPDKVMDAVRKLPNVLSVKQVRI